MTLKYWMDWKRIGFIVFALIIFQSGGLAALFGLLIVSIVLLIFLWALTVLGKGFFPWAYPQDNKVEAQQPEQDGLVAPVPVEATPVRMDEFIQRSNSVELTPKKCNCGTMMEGVKTLPGYYCFNCGRSLLIKPDGKLVDL